MIRKTFLGMAWCMIVGVAMAEPSQVLILSGQNNHQWQVTTPWLQRALEDTGRFEVSQSPNA